MKWLLWALVMVSFVGCEQIAEDMKSPIDRCWNQVVIAEGDLVWPDSCKGQPSKTPAECKPGNVELTDEELGVFKEWKESEALVPLRCE